ncbi:hypothetical protein RESH_04162 [Rhodopirellula europaea SH398]|uniref:Uncharacterized protein n=1 Tax=Rhodopirellula europaea SH398 TaxID=1263868 RepID=M5S1I8_9BACT|nr:hypothetical protein RESH_04162 [Rhodopirellula europaea SH398]
MPSADHEVRQTHSITSLPMVSSTKDRSESRQDFRFSRHQQNS